MIEDPKEVTAHDETIIEGTCKPSVELLNSFDSDAFG